MSGYELSYVALASRDAFLALDPNRREALLAFLEAL